MVLFQSKMHYLQHFAYNISKFLGVIPWTALAGWGNSPHPPQHGRLCVLRPPVLENRHQFPFGSPVFPLFIYYETTIDTMVCLLGVHTVLGHFGDARLMATIHDYLYRFLLCYGNKWPSRFVQRGTQHSDGITGLFLCALLNYLQ